MVCLHGYIFLIDESLQYYVVSSLSLFWLLCGNLFCLINYCYHIFFPRPFAWYIFCIPSLSVCVYLLLWFGSLVGHICGSHFLLLYTATLCLFIRAFNPFIFKVIIDRHLFIEFFPLYPCYSLIFSPHLLKAVPLSSLAILVWWRCTVLTFLYRKSLQKISFKMEGKIGE